jgi:phosphoribosylglycinamide formyltransferase 2
MISQDLSEFALHARAILGLPIPNIAFHGPSASKAIVARGDSDDVTFSNLDKVLEAPNTTMRIFGKGEVHGHRRVGVLLARDETVDAALARVFKMSEDLELGNVK